MTPRGKEVEELTVQQRLRYAAMPDQSGQRWSAWQLLLDADAEITRLSTALAEAEYRGCKRTWWVESADA